MPSHMYSLKHNKRKFGMSSATILLSTLRVRTCFDVMAKGSEARGKGIY